MFADVYSLFYSRIALWGKFEWGPHIVYNGVILMVEEVFKLGDLGVGKGSGRGRGAGIGSWFECGRGAANGGSG